MPSTGTCSLQTGTCVLQASVMTRCRELVQQHADICIACELVQQHSDILHRVRALPLSPEQSSPLSSQVMIIGSGPAADAAKKAAEQV